MSENKHKLTVRRVLWTVLLMALAAVASHLLFGSSRTIRHLQQENAALREEAEKQRQELIRTHSELLELQQKNRRLATANALTAAEGAAEATKRLNALIAQVDRAIAALKK